MATTPMISPMPVLRVTADYYVRFEAIDPATGDPVTGVTVSESVLFADSDQAGGADESGANWFLPQPPAA